MDGPGGADGANAGAPEWPGRWSAGPHRFSYRTMSSEDESRPLRWRAAARTLSSSAEACGRSMAMPDAARASTIEAEPECLPMTSAGEVRPTSSARKGSQVLRLWSWPLQ